MTVEIYTETRVVEIVGGEEVGSSDVVEIIELVGMGPAGPQGPIGPSSSANDFDPGDLAALFIAS